MAMPQRASAGEISAAAEKPRRVLAVDYGRKRIGLALSDALGLTAQPLAILMRVNRQNDLRRLREACRTHGVTHIIVGHPLHMTGEAGEMADEAARFAARLEKEIGIGVELVDERLTSWEAERLLEEQAGKIFRDDSLSAHVHASAHANVRKKKQAERATVDAMAAAVILKEYLAKRQNPGASI